MQFTRLLSSFTSASVALLLFDACQAATQDKKVGAGMAVGAGVAGAAVYRAATGGCWAQCTHGMICDPVSGTCVDAPRRDRAHAPGLPPADAASRWWEHEPACPPGAALDRDGFDGEERRAILCRKDGVPEGRATFFYSSGRKQEEGDNCAGKPCHRWTYWDEDGRVNHVEDLAEPQDH